MSQPQKFRKEEEQSLTEAQKLGILALREIERKNYQEAITILDRMLSLEPGDFGGHFNRGVCYANLNNLPKSADDFERAASIEPKNVDAWEQAAFRRFDSGDLDKAIADAEKAIVLYGDVPRSYDVRHIKAYAYIKRNSGDKALGDLEKMVRYRRYVAEDHAMLRDIYSSRGDAAQAQAAESKRKLSQDESFRKTLAHANELYEAQDYVGSIAEYEKAISADSANPKFWFYRGLSHYYLEDFAAALPDLETALKLDPKNGQACYHVAKSHQELGDKEKAKSYFRMLMEIDPESSDQMKEEIASLE